MKRGLFLLLCSFMSACRPSAEVLAQRGRQLQAEADRWIQHVVAGRFEEAGRMCLGEFSHSDKLESVLSQTRVPRAALTDGVLYSLAWISPKEARVKVLWTFQEGWVQSLSAETFYFVYRNDEWKFVGRLRR